MEINWNEPKFYQPEIDLVTEVLESGYVSEGPFTRELEASLASKLDVRHVIMTTSATAALKLAIEAVKCTHWEENMSASIPSLTFLATQNALIDSDVKVNIMDVDRKTFTIDSHTGNIFMPVNMLGRSVGRKFIEDLQDSGFPVICDNAGCLGSDVPIGDIGCYSLQGNKIISCGQGGFCATNSDTYARLIRRYKDFGRSDKDDVDCYSLNYKFNDILAAVALGQLQKLEERKELLLHQYNRYKDALEYNGKFVDFKDGEVPLWIEFKPNRDRNTLFEKLKKKGINCRKPWKPLKTDGCPNAKYYSDNYLWLPSGCGLTNEKQQLVINAIKEC